MRRRRRTQGESGREDGRTGLLVQPRDAVGFANAISAILRDGTRAERLRAAALERARAYDWRVLSARVLGVYQRVLSESLR